MSESELRLLPDARGGEGHRHMDLGAALRLFKQSKMDDWKLPGPRVTLELLSAVVDGPGDLTVYHNEWVRRSGVGENAAVCHNHYPSVRLSRPSSVSIQSMFQTCWVSKCWCERWYKTKSPSTANPKHPDYGGLDIMLHAPTTEAGSAQVAGFTFWVTDRLIRRTFTTRRGCGSRSSVSVSTLA